MHLLTYLLARARGRRLVDQGLVGLHHQIHRPDRLFCRDGGMDGWRDGWMCGCVDVWMCGWVDVWMAPSIRFFFINLLIFNIAVAGFWIHPLRI